jgi:hypothetical protein
MVCAVVVIGVLAFTWYHVGKQSARIDGIIRDRKQDAKTRRITEQYKDMTDSELLNCRFWQTDAWRFETSCRWVKAQRVD